MRRVWILYIHEKVWIYMRRVWIDMRGVWIYMRRVWKCTFTYESLIVLM